MAVIFKTIGRGKDTPNREFPNAIQLNATVTVDGNGHLDVRLCKDTETAPPMSRQTHVGTNQQPAGGWPLSGSGSSTKYIMVVTGNDISNRYRVDGTWKTKKKVPISIK